LTAREILTSSTVGAALKLKRKTVPPLAKSKYEPVPEVEFNPYSEMCAPPVGLILREGFLVLHLTSHVVSHTIPA
jgi:hypothetical protein